MQDELFQNNNESQITLFEVCKDLITTGRTELFVVINSILIEQQYVNVQPKEMLLLYYIYYCLLSDEEKIRANALRYTILLDTNKMMCGIYKTTNEEIHDVFKDEKDPFLEIIERIKYTLLHFFSPKDSNFSNFLENLKPDDKDILRIINAVLFEGYRCFTDEALKAICMSFSVIDYKNIYSAFDYERFITALYSIFIGIQDNIIYEDINETEKMFLDETNQINFL